MFKIILLLIIIFFLFSYYRARKFIDNLVLRSNFEKDKETDVDISSFDKYQRIVYENKEKGRYIENKYMEKFQNIDILSEDGIKLCSKYRENIDSDYWCILLHGYTADNHTMMTFAHEYINKGFSVLIPNHRAHGNSAGEYTTFGIKEKEDLKRWIKWIDNKQPNSKIVVHGVSMGAATTMYLAEDDIDNVIAYIEDCGFTNYYNVAKFKYGNNILLKPFLMLANVIFKNKYGGDLFKSTLSTIIKTNKPMLFIHGGNDELIPASMCGELYEKSNSEFKKMYIAPNAGHADAKNINPTKYFDVVFNFIDQVLAQYSKFIDM